MFLTKNIRIKNFITEIEEEIVEEKVIDEQPVEQEQPVVEEVSEEPVASPEPDVAAVVAQAKKATPKPQTTSQNNTVLRVDSKRIDYLLNLVSETVITKAAFNQTSIQVGDLQTQLQSIEASYKDKVHRLFDQIPRYLESMQGGATMKEIKSSLNQDFGDLFNVFDPFDVSFKNITGKFRSSTQNLGRIAGELQEGVMKIRMVPISQIFSMISSNKS